MSPNRKTTAPIGVNHHAGTKRLGEISQFSNYSLGKDNEELFLPISHLPLSRSPLSTVCNCLVKLCYAPHLYGIICWLMYFMTRFHACSSFAASQASKSQKLSLVWTLSGSQSSQRDLNQFRYQRLLPHLLPWKRATYCRSSFPSSANYNNSSLSMIRRSLLSSRKRDVVYTRSGHGLSLRRSKIVSLAGSSLKWSKSIEKCSKKANEAATRAVAATAQSKRVRAGTSDVISGVEGRKNLSSNAGERIFRIGTSRYRMDSSKRALQRIPDKESSCLGASKQENVARISYVPKRLLIGNNEYVRIGNGNQLIRDPKRRTRILASEKIRRSLHTVKKQLAKRQKYCQFFTRFGRCNKDEGKCPYIHDPSKIAVCTKFLNGLCADQDCKLTHKVIPERMPDCSFFLQGLCSNENCPYRHVNVNPKASICDSFLRGYCADGNECRKKHSYICPAYEETGSCPQGSKKCKLYHPKKDKGNQRTFSIGRKKGHNRYFRIYLRGKSEPKTMTMVDEKHSAQETGDMPFEVGVLGDYISLDVGQDESLENGEQENEPTTLLENDLGRSKFDFLDLVIKPVRILDKNPSLE